MGSSDISFALSSKGGDREGRRWVVTSDTILSSMAASLLPQIRYAVEAILPPDQCPGHYDMKLSDIEKIGKADLLISFKGMSFFHKVSSGKRAQLWVETGGRNWMVPDAYLFGLEVLAEGLVAHFPEDREEILKRKGEVILRVKEVSRALTEKMKTAGVAGKAMIASSMQKGFLEWMGFRVVGEYGRPESISAREVIRLSKIGREQKAVAVVDNLQSGPEAGKGIAEALGVPHVVLTNFPSEKGYLATLQENVEILLSTLKGRGENPF
ncbi:MAG: zinc ABC transporter substrate-binding protein [Desulfobacterota bacterium]|nr:zinc ABC transporter substrate-binding protein [Thermodesulfobacteriota bacterium]